MPRTPLYLFDPGPYLPSLALIRIPRSLSTSAATPHPDDEFGTGFFITATGVLLTAGHNLTADGTPDGDLLPWIWVCSFDAIEKDWTESVKVRVHPQAIDRSLDAAVLMVPRARMSTPICVAADWARGDSIVVLGFQPDRNRPSGFDVHWLPCIIPQNFPVAPLDIGTGAREPTLRLIPVEGALPIGKGISGGPAIKVDHDEQPAIAIEKAAVEAFELRSPEIRTTAIRWLRGMLDQLPDAGEVHWVVARAQTHPISVPTVGPVAAAAGVRPGSAATGLGGRRQASPAPIATRVAARLRAVCSPAVLALAMLAIALPVLALLPWWNTLDLDVAGPLATRAVRFFAGDAGTGSLPLATDAVVRDEQGPVLELTRHFDTRFRQESEFGRGWRVFVPFSLRADTADKTVVLGQLSGPRRIEGTNHVTGARLDLVYEDRQSGESGYFGSGLEPFTRLAIQTNGGFYLDDLVGHEVQFDQALRPIVVDLDRGVRWVYHYWGGRVAAVQSLPVRVELSDGTASGAMTVVDPLGNAKLPFVGEESGLSQFASETAGRWRRAFVAPPRTVRLYDRWGDEFIFLGLDRFIILNNVDHPAVEDSDAIRHGITFGFDRLGRVERATIDALGEVRYEYDATDRLVAVVGLDGRRSDYRYDANGMPVRRMSIRTTSLRALLVAAGLVSAAAALIAVRRR